MVRAGDIAQKVLSSIPRTRKKNKTQNIINAAKFTETMVTGDNGNGWSKVFGEYEDLLMDSDGKPFRAVIANLPQTVCILERSKAMMVNLLMACTAYCAMPAATGVGEGILLGNCW